MSNNIANENWKLNSIIKLFLFCILLNSCSKDIYTIQNEFGIYKFTVYHNHNFEYKESSIRGKYCSTGNYEVDFNKKIISFIFRDWKKIPSNYFQCKIIELSPRKNNDKISLKITDNYKEPILFCQVLFLDSLFNVIDRMETDMDGNLEFVKNSKYYCLQIESQDFGKQIIELKNTNSNNLSLELEQLERGGRMEGACLMEYIDYLAKYKIDEPSNIKRFWHNGIIYKQKSNQTN